MLLADKLALIALDERTGRPKMDTGELHTCLIGALACELALLGRIALDKKSLVVTDASPTGNSMLDAALAALGRRKGKKINKQFDAISKAIGAGTFWGLQRAPKRIFQSLAQQGLVVPGRSGVFRRKCWKPDADARQSVIAEIRQTAVDPSPQPEAGMLLVLVVSAKALPNVFPDKAQRKAAEARATTVIETLPVAEATREVLKYLQNTLWIVVFAVVASGALPG